VGSARANSLAVQSLRNLQKYFLLRLVAPWYLGIEPAGPLLDLRGENQRQFFELMGNASLVSELERLATAVAAQKPGEQKISLPVVAARIAKTLGVRAEEVAILAVSEKWRHLHFLVPQALKNVGFIPLSSPSALAARTARENRAEFDNRFHDTRHARVFEGVKAATLSAEVIQKILSAPILLEEKVIGVLQVSRKGMSLSAAGPDFSTVDIANVVALCRPLGKLIQPFARD